MNLMKSAKEISTIHNKFDRFKYQIIGHFSNKEQVLETNEPIQEFVVMPILQSDRVGEFWVYLEFFSPKLAEEPIDQRIEQYVQLDRETYRMEVYYLKNPKKFINIWKTGKVPVISITEDLIRDESCDLIIKYQRDKPGTFKTTPPEEITCKMLTATGPAKYVDLTFELFDDRYLMWFTFYDKDKAYLKATRSEGQIFKRLKRQDLN